MNTEASILVVEDEAIVAISIGWMLEDCGYRITGIVASAEEAIRTAKTHRPDLVLMDINLGSAMDGINTARLLMEQFGTLILYVTAQMDRETRERALAVGPAGFLTKPFTPEELESAVSQALTRRKT